MSVHVYVKLLQEETSGEITLYMKGADVVMQTIVQYNDWLDEEVRNLSASSFLPLRRIVE